jgi:hypothetical protein
MKEYIKGAIVFEEKFKFGPTKPISLEGGNRMRL